MRIVGKLASELGSVPMLDVFCQRVLNLVQALLLNFPT